MPDRPPLKVIWLRPRSSTLRSISTSPFSSSVRNSASFSLSIGLKKPSWFNFSTEKSHRDFSVLKLNQRSEEHTSELQSLAYLVCRLLLEKKKQRSRLAYRTH